MGSKKVKIKESNHIKRIDYKWAVIITLWTFFISVILTLVSNVIMPKANISTAIVILMLFVSAGVFSDMIGLAIATANESPFHSMAAHRVGGARNAIFLIRNAEKVSNFFNDVVGDIAGIISGSTTAIIVLRITQVYGYDSIIVSLIFTGFVAAITVGGKAIGKGFALKNSNKVTYEVALAFYYFDKIRGKEERNANHK